MKVHPEPSFPLWIKQVPVSFRCAPFRNEPWIVSHQVNLDADRTPVPYGVLQIIGIVNQYRRNVLPYNTRLLKSGHVENPRLNDVEPVYGRFVLYHGLLDQGITPGTVSFGFYER